MWQLANIPKLVSNCDLFIFSKYFYKINLSSVYPLQVMNIETLSPEERKERKAELEKRKLMLEEKLKQKIEELKASCLEEYVSALTISIQKVVIYTSMSLFFSLSETDWAPSKRISKAPRRT